MACSPFWPRPSMVMICLPATSLTGVEQDRTACLSTMTVQAPQKASPHPNLVPVRPRSERSTHNSMRSSSTFTLAGLPRSEEHTSELQSLRHLVCRLLLEKKKKNKHTRTQTYPARGPSPPTQRVRSC